jgi:hypothetical protein
VACIESSQALGGIATLDPLQLEIARFLAGKAKRHTRATYQQVGEAVRWPHPTGRGLGRNLYAILHSMRDKGHPPLTAILVKKGEKHPPSNVIAEVRKNYTYRDIDEAQDSVFAFDWSSVAELGVDDGSIPTGREVWLTSFWGFDPRDWGCIGFADEARRARYLRLSKPGALVAIYVTKGRGPEEMRGKVVGILEVSHQTGHASEFISGDRWAEKENDPEYKGKWLFAVRAARAWRIIPEDWKPVEDLFPTAYASANPEFIGSNGVGVSESEAERLFQLEVYETPVYGQSGPIDGTFRTLETALLPSRAVPPAISPYWVGETDGPKHLYILELKGDTAAYLGRMADRLDGMSIIKVGFSRSPLSRRDQIQSAYPRGQFNWVVRYPESIVDPPPYPNARVAIVGEDAMKKRLVEEGAEVLGGEFFLAEEGQVIRTWYAGKFAADTANSADK